MLKCIIVDDQERDRQNLRLLLKTYCPDVEVLTEAHDAASLQTALNDFTPDVVFFDIELGKVNCFDVLDQMHMEAYNFKIIFVTGSENYAIKGYSYDGVDYILKPILPEKLIKVVHKAKQLIHEDTSNKQTLDNLNQLHNESAKSAKIHIKEGKNVYFPKTEDILCIIGGRNYTTVKLADNTEIITLQKLKDFEEQLNDSIFIRVHRSYLINLSHITSFSRDEGFTAVLANTVEVPVSKNYKNQLLAKISLEE